MKLFSLWGKVGFILLNNKGFTLIEVIIASSILFTVITTLAPLVTIIKYERHTLNEKRIISSYLHDELQEFLWKKNNPVPHSTVESVKYIDVKLSFTRESNYIKGCASWKNVKDKQEVICLYGVP